MRYFSLFLFLVFILFHSTSIHAQSPTGVMSFYSAQWYDNFEGAARIAKVRELQNNQWNALDTIYEWDNDNQQKDGFRVIKQPLEPYLDENGFVVYWVSEVAPHFPGGKEALVQYKRDILGSLFSGPDDEVQKNIRIRCTIDAEGNVIDVAEAQSHSEWIAREIIDRCLDGVRYMPAWAPGIFRGKPVCVCLLVDFALKQ